LLGGPFRNDGAALPVRAAVDGHEDAPGVDPAERLSRVTGRARESKPEHVHRRPEILDLHAGVLADDGMTAVSRHHEIRADLERAAWALGLDTDDCSAFLEHAGDLRAHQESEGWIARALVSEKIEEVPLGHEREEAA